MSYKTIIFTTIEIWTVPRKCVSQTPWLSYIHNSLITRSYILSQQNTFALIGFQYFCIALFSKVNVFPQNIQLHQLINIFFQAKRHSLNWASNLQAIHSKFSNNFAFHISGPFKFSTTNKSFTPFPLYAFNQ